MISPGRPSSRAIISGKVSLLRRTRKLLAPNSPSETAQATRCCCYEGGFDQSSKSIVRHICQVVAPNVCEASRNPCGKSRIVGEIIRITIGIATKQWAIGIISQDPRQSIGLTSNVMMIPRPRVTAETTTGNAVSKIQKFVSF